MTYRIPLLPFSLKECEEYAESLDLNLNREQLAECYMILGGIPGLERARHQQYGEAIQLMNW